MASVIFYGQILSEDSSRDTGLPPLGGRRSRGSSMCFPLTSGDPSNPCHTGEWEAGAGHQQSRRASCLGSSLRPAGRLEAPHQARQTAAAATYLRPADADKRVPSRSGDLGGVKDKCRGHNVTVSLVVSGYLGMLQGKYRGNAELVAIISILTARKEAPSGLDGILGASLGQHPGRRWWRRTCTGAAGRRRALRTCNVGAACGSDTAFWRRWTIF